MRGASFEQIGLLLALPLGKGWDVFAQMVLTPCPQGPYPQGLSLA